MTISDKLVTIAENTPKVFDAGKQAGFAEGKQAAYDEFWDDYQQNGNRTDYSYAFAGYGWTLDTWKPKYGFPKIGNASYMFSQFRPTTNGIDLVQWLKDNNSSLDLSNCTAVTHLFSSSYITHAPELNLTKVTTFWPFASDSWIETIDKVILNSDGSTVFQTPFQQMKKLKNITFEGVIGKNGLSFQWSTLLSKESIKSIISCLSTTTSGLTVTFSLTAVKKAFETSANMNDGDASAEWKNLVAEHSNWTISLV